MITPLVERVDTNLNIFDVFSIFKDEDEVIFLESGLDKDRLGKYSFIGINPFITFKYKKGICIKNNEKFEGDVFTELNNIIKEYKIANETELPFIGGGMGYFSYDLVREMERLPEYNEEEVDIPHCYYHFYDNVIIYDHKSQHLYISALGIKEDKSISLSQLRKKILEGKKVEYKPLVKKDNQFQSKYEKEEYIHTVEKVRDYIRSGDIYIMNLTHTFSGDIDRSPYDIFKILRYINPAPFSAYMKLGESSIISSSPERFLEIKDGKVETRPIKGTRPRGKNKQEDIKNKEELLNSEKDKSELLMIVDLERNDLSKVCKPYSVKVQDLFELEQYSTVYHLVATVQGELKEDKTSIDCIKACFPGGSITGCPKIRAMEIIEELELTRRNIYTGCIGYIGFDGNVDLNIVIRTILLKDKKAYIGVGGGITWESDSEAEYYETLDKAKALLESLQLEEVDE